MSENEGAGPARGPCAVCGLDSGLLCTRCRGAFYCSAAHQLQHWPQHRATSCGYRYEVRCNESRARHLVAARNINKGDIIVKEKALVVVPHFEPETVVRNAAACGNCCRRLASLLPCEWEVCSACGLPLCSVDCKLSSGDAGLHTDAECALFKEARLDDKIQVKDRVPLLAAVRCLMLTGAKARTLRSLCANTGSPFFKPKLDATAALVRQLLGNMFEEEDVVFAMGAFLTNSFKLKYDKDKVVWTGLFGKISYASHSCRPNARHVVVGKNSLDFSGAIVANVDIPAGQEITISYVDVMSCLPVRNQELLSYKNFLCRCERCEDPTEMGLYFSSICCSHCRKLNMPIMSILQLEANGAKREFVCNVCHHRSPIKDVFDFIINEAFHVLEERHFPNFLPEQLLGRLLYPVGPFHPTSSVIVQVKMMIVMDHSVSIKDMTEQQLGRKLDLCRELLTLLDLIAPGQTGERGSVLEEMVVTMLELGLRKFTMESLEEAKFILLEAEHLSFEIKEIFIDSNSETRASTIKEMVKHIRSAVNTSGASG